jgi:phosphate transport system protein
MEHQLSVFDQDLSQIKESLLRMGVLVEESIYLAVEALKERDCAKAKEVIKKDVEIDHLELTVNEQSVNAIALHQPLAGDLRFLTTAMRIATDLERVGDLSEDIAQRAIELSGRPLLKPLIDIPKMAKLAKDSIALALRSFIDRDPDKAKDIWEKENQADDLRDKIHEELLEIIDRKPATAKEAIPLLLVSRHLERICDHATNIAEDVVYMVEAKVVKHSGS